MTNTNNALIIFACGDIDDCNQKCTNTNGSFQCSCNNGYSLSSDERSCLQEGTEEKMQVATTTNEGTA